MGANTRFLTLLGYRLEQLKGQEWLERLLPNDAALTLRHSIKSGQHEIGERTTVIIKADGSWNRVNLEIRVNKKMGIVSVRAN